MIYFFILLGLYLLLGLWWSDLVSLSWLKGKDGVSPRSDAYPVWKVRGSQ